MVRWFTLASAHGRLETRNTNIKSGLWSINKAWASCHAYTMVHCQLFSSLVYCSPWYAFQLIYHRKRKEKKTHESYNWPKDECSRALLFVLRVYCQKMNEGNSPSAKACKASGNWATWIDSAIGILEVLAPYLGEPRLVLLVTSGLELVCELILWQILQTNSQAENVNIAVAHRQPSSLNLTMVPLQQQRVWQHQEAGAGGERSFYTRQMIKYGHWWAVV